VDSSGSEEEPVAGLCEYVKAFGFENVANLLTEDTLVSGDVTGSSIGQTAAEGTFGVLGE
jgi:hypothetical protein